MELIFISDFFVDEIRGGAEIVDHHLLDLLSKKKIIVKKIKSSQLSENFIKDNIDKTFMISNFTMVQKRLLNILSAGKYFIFEHDHKYTIDRDVSSYKDYLVPQNRLVNIPFYQNAQAVFCQSKIHAEVVRKNIKSDNVINLGCSIWSDKELMLLEQCAKNPKTKKCAIVDSSNPIKSTQKSINFCKKNNLQYDLISSPVYDDFISSLSNYESLVFFPKVLESFCRLAVEARILNCSLKTNNNLGCASEPWFTEYKGLELVGFIREKREEIVETVFKKICEERKQTTGDITVILNAYRRPYNLKMQIDAIRKQTIKPKQIWLWVNDHEDNREFNFKELGLDRIFHNDYNWKFYGRFAGALLSDTEYVAIFDDDTIPGERWFENCFKTMNTNEGILGSAGVTLNDKYYVRHNRCGWATQNKQTTRVDLVGHAWFFKREWLSHLWREKPTTWDNGEDIQFSYLAQKYGNIQTYCPPHPPENKSLHGSILGNELGIDSKATSTNQAVSHNQFFSERDHCVQTAIKGGWKTVKEIKV